MPSATTPTSAASQPYSDQGFGVGMPLPKRVKSVMVKPDGTIVNGQDGAAPDAASQAPAPAKPDDRIGALVDGATPAAATPKPHAKAAKTTTRVATVAPIPAPESIDEAAGATPAPKPSKAASKKTKPVKVATAETGTEQAANDAGEEAKPAGNGGFAVQLAAPGSEADARSATSKLLKKYAGALHGQRLGFHRAGLERQDRLPRPGVEPDEGGCREPLLEAEGRGRAPASSPRTDPRSRHGRACPGHSRGAASGMLVELSRDGPAPMAGTGPAMTSLSWRHR